MKAPREHKTAFTLLEVMAVVLILALLAGVFIGVVRPMIDRARLDTTRRIVEDVVPSALDKFNIDLGRYPSEDEGLESLVKKPATFENEDDEKKWGGPYLKKDPKDAWGRDLHYEPVEAGAEEGVTRPYKVWSDGPNKQSGDDDDIRSWSEEEQT